MTKNNALCNEYRVLPDALLHPIDPLDEDGAAVVCVHAFLGLHVRDLGVDGGEGHVATVRRHGYDRVHHLLSRLVTDVTSHDDALRHLTFLRLWATHNFTF